MDWKAVIGKVAPTLAAALGGPFAGAAIAAAAKALGCPADEKSISDGVLFASPDQLLALKKAEQDFAAKMRELDVQDMASARDRETKTGDKTTRELALAYTTAYFGILILLMLGWLRIPETSSEVFITLLGVLTAAQSAVLNYYFGSSHGSAQKNEMLSRR